MDKKFSVYFIDDEENILNSLKRTFRKAEFDSFFTTDARELMEKIIKEPPAIVVSDQRMPHLDGAEILKRVKALSPKTLRIMLTGYADIQAAIKAVNEGNIYRFLTKPWQDTQLREVLEEAIKVYSLTEENEALNKVVSQKNQELLELNQSLEARVIERTQEIEKLNLDLKKNFLSSIKMMGSIPGILKDSYDGHSVRVAKFAGAIAKELSLDDKAKFEVQVAGYLHDVAHVAFMNHPLFNTSLVEVADKSSVVVKQAEGEKSAKLLAMERLNLVEKPKELSREEKELNEEKQKALALEDAKKAEEQKLLKLEGIANQKALLSAKIVSLIPGLGEAANYVKYHRELFALSAGKIPVGAMILKIAKDFDNLMNVAENEKPKTLYEAMHTIEDQVGKSYSPEVFKAMKRVIAAGQVYNQDDKEQQIEIFELKEGMILSRPIVNNKGEMLLDANFKISADVLELLWTRQIEEQAVTNIYVFKESMPKVAKPKAAKAA